ncbi:MAG: N-acetyl sugar amidotransferase [Granulosicoccus sp.]
MPKTCKKCLYTENHPFGMTFLDGECLGCVTHKEKTTLDWDLRREQLESVFNKNTSQKRSYDCVVPICGDAEDYFTLNTLLGAGMSPLVVCINDYFKNDIGWHNLHNLITFFDVDSLVFNTDMSVYKELVRTSLRKFNHVLLPYLQLHTSFPVHVAQQHKIPLVVWGQNQAVEQVGKCSHTDEIEMSRWSRKEHDLFNVDTDTLIGNGTNVIDKHLNYYQYPSPDDLHRSAIRGIYLSNYIPWDPLVQNRNAVEQGYSPQQQTSTFDPYERAGSSVYYGIHDLLKLKRNGYRKIHDHLTREIRHQRLSLVQARSLSKHYSNSVVDVKGFFDWLDVTTSGYQWFVKHRLADVKRLIGTPEPFCGTRDSMPAAVSSLLVEGEIPNNEYITFGKGISI